MKPWLGKTFDKNALNTWIDRVPEHSADAIASAPAEVPHIRTWHAGSLKPVDAGAKNLSTMLKSLAEGGKANFVTFVTKPS